MKYTELSLGEGGKHEEKFSCQRGIWSGNSSGRNHDNNGGCFGAVVVIFPRSCGVPSKGQSAKQQSKDEGECFTWAKQQTGIDPAAVASAPTQQPGPATGGGERLRGAARGAAGGAAIGAIAGDAGKGAGIGAVVGTMAGGRQARKNKAAKEEQAAQQKAGTLQQFNKAFGVCMEGRGYAVK